MGKSLKRFNTSTQDEQRTITPHKSITPLNKLGNASDGTTRGMPAKKLIALAVTLLAGVAFLFLSIDRGRAPDQPAAQIQGKEIKIKSVDDQIGVNAQQMLDEGR